MLQCICTFGVHACAPVYMHFMNNSGYKCIYTSVYALLFTYSVNGCLGISTFSIDDTGSFELDDEANFTASHLNSEGNPELINLAMWEHSSKQMSKHDGHQF